MNTLIIHAALFRGPVNLTPTSYKQLVTLIRAMKRLAPLRMASTPPAPLWVDGKLNFRHLDFLPLGTLHPVQALDRYLTRVAPDFLKTCILRTQQKFTTRERSAPLAGLITGQPRNPALSRAFFDLVKIKVMAERQAATQRQGMEIAGVSRQTTARLSPADFIDPFIVYTGEGTDADLRAEGALLRLSMRRWENRRVFDGEDVKSRAEELAEKERTFAHADVQLLPPALVHDVYEEEGVTLPATTNAAELAEAARALTNPVLTQRVAAALADASAVSDHQRQYLHNEGTPAFVVKKSLPAAPWTPYTPTMGDSVPMHHELNRNNPLAGYTAFDHTPTGTPATSSLRVVSQATFSAMQERLGRAETRRSQLQQDMERALEDGDLSESAFYDETRTALQDIQHLITQLTHDLHQVTVGDVTSTNIGATLTLDIAGQPVTVRLTDDQPCIGEVSVNTPLGRQLLTATPGEHVEVTYDIRRMTRTLVPTITTTGTHATARQVPEGIHPPRRLDRRTQYARSLAPARTDITEHRTLNITVISVHRPTP